VRHDLENARAEATAASERALAAAATRAKLEGRLAEFEDRLRATHDQSQRAESELQAQRDRVVALTSESDHGRSLADGDREADRLRLEQLTADFDKARAANERLRSLLNVFGLVDHLGSGAGLPPSV
jgi:chromosome segregation ATPase